jgi:hypothetical protein
VCVMSWRRIIEIAEPVHGGKCCQFNTHRWDEFYMPLWRHNGQCKRVRLSVPWT